MTHPQLKTDAGELEELRELKSDIQRREKTQADMIAAQAKQLRELETLYKDEMLQRRRYHNMLEDMKVGGMGWGGWDGGDQSGAVGDQGVGGGADFVGVAGKGMYSKANTNANTSQ